MDCARGPRGDLVKKIPTNCTKKFERVRIKAIRTLFDSFSTLFDFTLRNPAFPDTGADIRPQQSIYDGEYRNGKQNAQHTAQTRAQRYRRQHPDGEMCIRDRHTAARPPAYWTKTSFSCISLLFYLDDAPFSFVPFTRPPCYFTKGYCSKFAGAETVT